LKHFSQLLPVPGTPITLPSLSGMPQAGISPTRSQTMKTLATFTAIATLVAGVSFAQAQGTMGSPSPGTTMQKSQTIGNSPFCINMSASGGLNCKYASMAACEKDAKPQNLNCLPNPNKSTTGSRQ
jgi:hypothetical protein